MFVDTHCHLDIIQTFGRESNILSSDDFLKIEEILLAAKEKGVSQIINIGCDFQTSKNSLDLAQRFDKVWASIGIHPTDCKENWSEQWSKIKALVGTQIKAQKVLAVGEIGLDFYHKGFDLGIQKKALRVQVEFALENDLAIVFHVREAGQTFLEEIAPLAKDIKRAVIHCFQQDQAFADKVLSWGFLIGIDGPITYPKSASLRSVVDQVPLERIVLETDSPFLPTQPNRGKLNYPWAIVEVAQEISKIKGVSLEKVAEITTLNARRLFFS